MTDIFIAIGDIHGEHKMLCELVDRCRKIMHGSYPMADYKFVFLGDLIDRGPESDKVLRDLEMHQDSGDIVIRGNHDDWMHDAVIEGNGDARTSWMIHGGKTTRASFGQLPNSPWAPVERYYARWLGKLPVYYATAHYIFVHAGVNPEKSLGEQSHEFMMWARPADWINDWKGPRHVVFGHTPMKDRQPILTPHATGLDTGACFAHGALTAGFFRNDFLAPAGPFLLERVERPMMGDGA